jgi:hypothetical protein
MPATVNITFEKVTYGVVFESGEMHYRVFTQLCIVINLKVDASN